MNISRFFLTLLAPVALAQEGQLIGVTFDFAVDDLAFFLGDQDVIEVKKKEIATSLATSCIQHIGFWSFKEGSETSHPSHLKVEIVEGGQLWKMKVVLKCGKPVDDEWECDLFEPDELDLYGVPAASEWPIRIREAFEMGILVNNKAALMEELKKIPVGNRFGILDKKVLVLPLRFDSLLADSKFRVVYKKDHADEMITPPDIHVQTQVKCRPSLFPGPPEFMGLRVEHEKWWVTEKEPKYINEDFIRALDGYKPHAFYLKEPNRDPNSCDVGSLTAGGVQ